MPLLSLPLLGALLTSPLLFLTGGAHAASHDDPVAPILLALAMMAVAAAIGGRFMRKFGQAAVLGELLIGVLVGNLGYLYHQPSISVIREGETVSTIVQTALTQKVTVGEAARQVLPPGLHAERIAEILEGPGGLRCLLYTSPSPRD